MANPFDEVRVAVRNSEALNQAVDENVNAMLDCIAGRLRNATGWKLKRLKKELQDFNARTEEWS